MATHWNFTNSRWTLSPPPWYWSIKTYSMEIFTSPQVIKLIFKKGKDLKEPGSYHPISLLNLDSKLLLKIVMNRLVPIMPPLIHLSQAGFTQGRAASSNIKKVLTVLEHARANLSGDTAIVTLDAEKAFDNVGFHWLKMFLSKFGFSGPFFHLINTMYSAPSMNVIAAGLISNICLHKGTQEGCPLSPLQFNLALEPLFRYLLFHSKLHRVKVGSQELWTALFADDILIFTSDPCTDMLHIQEVFTLFHDCSGLRINFSKSKILPLFQTKIHIPGNQNR